LRDQKKERRIKKYSNSEREGSLFQKLRESEAQGPWPISQKSHSIVLKQNKTKQEQMEVACSSRKWTIEQQ
jgi:hypothetical protein